jgi:predicted nucleotidyltransferase
MDTNIPKILPINIKLFFKHLKKFIKTELYFFGSILRYDYYHTKSDIDISIFSNNPYNLILTLHKFILLYENAYKKLEINKNNNIFCHNNKAFTKYSFIFYFKKIDSYINFAILNIKYKKDFIYSQNIYFQNINSLSYTFIIINILKYMCYKLNIIKFSIMKKIIQIIKYFFFIKTCY